MTSNLKWRTGFDWGSVALLSIALGGSYITSGALRWLFAIIGGLVAMYMAHQYQKWNTAGWRGVHFRAMLAYARIAGQVQATSMAKNQPFDVVVACRELGLLLCGPGSEEAVDVMISHLLIERGSYLATVVGHHLDEVLPNLTQPSRAAIIERLQGVGFGPQLLIANVVKNSFGSCEAARYAVALVTGEAH